VFFFHLRFSCLPVSQCYAQFHSFHSLRFVSAPPPSAQILSTLGSSVKEGRSTAALVIGKLAAIEVPRGLWNDLVPLLLHNVQAAPTKDLKQSTFEALGYVCEEVPEHLQAHSNGVLVAVASGMSADETDASVKLAATTALGNSLEFIKTNMSVEVRRRSRD
jgi:importin subunit beta-1